VRVFIAIDLDARTLAAAAKVTSVLRRVIEQSEPAARLSWTAPERQHVTVHFIGEVETPATLIAIMKRPLPITPFELRLAEPGTFPRHGRPRVLWLGVAAPDDALQSVHRLLGERLKAAGFAIETGPYTPHLTLARVRTPIKAGTWSRALAAAPRVSAHTRVREMTLYESRLKGSASVYVPLAAASLEGTLPPSASA
jgi:2'-5' RNA ligase